LRTSCNDTHDAGSDGVSQPPAARDQHVLEAFAYESKIRARLYRYTRNRADADEILQETYVRLLSLKGPDVVPIGSVLAFVMTVARNIACDWLRHQKVLSISLVADLDLQVTAEGTQPDEWLSLEQELELLADIVESMPPRRREAFTLRKVYGLSQKEIARTLRISVNTVEQHLSSAVRYIDQVLTARRQPDVTLRCLKTQRTRWHDGAPLEAVEALPELQSPHQPRRNEPTHALSRD
jgi:RNA polymerase sigma factor (sigma-70 family)